MSQNALKRFFPNDLHHEEGFHREIETRLPKRRCRILDLGCGSNQEMARYRDVGHLVWGTDFQAHSQLVAPEWFRPLRNDGTIPFPDDHFDLVTAVMVLEHVTDPSGFLQEAARVLRPGGVFIGHTVSARHYVTWIRRAFGVLPHRVVQCLVRRLYGRADEDTFPTTYRMNGERSLSRFASRAGLTLEGIRRHASPCYFGFTPLTAYLATLLDWSLEKLGPGFGRLYLTVTLRKPTPVQRQAC